MATNAFLFEGKVQVILAPWDIAKIVCLSTSTPLQMRHQIHGFRYMSTFREAVLHRMAGPMMARR